MLFTCLFGLWFFRLLMFSERMCKFSVTFHGEYDKSIFIWLGLNFIAKKAVFWFFGIGQQLLIFLIRKIFFYDSVSLVELAPGFLFVCFSIWTVQFVLSSTINSNSCNVFTSWFTFWLISPKPLLLLDMSQGPVLQRPLPLFDRFLLEGIV